MSEKIIIKNQAGLTTSEALRRVGAVVDGGKISGKGDKLQYCYLSVFEDSTSISCDKNKGDSFTFTLHPARGEESAA